MRRMLAVFCLVAFTLTLAAQSPAGSQARNKTAGETQAAVPQPGKSLPGASLPEKNSPIDLPVRKVVLYKNGVGYFEHAGSVTRQPARGDRLYFAAVERCAAVADGAG